MRIIDESSEKAVFLIEWPEKASGFLPPVDLKIALTHLELSRLLTLQAYTAVGQQTILSLQNFAEI